MDMNKVIKEKYRSYPQEIRVHILKLRDLILEVAKCDDQIDFIGEDLKWGEPSFLTHSSGSTFRLDWKKKSPESISLFFNCQTKLISIFKELYPEDFVYVGNRELRLPLNGKYSKKNLKKCVELALKYNLIKDEFKN